MRLFAVVVAAGLAIHMAPVLSQGAVKIGVLTELSGPLGPSGSGQRDGFLLYLKKNGNRLGGKPVEVVVEDTANDPQTAITKARKLVESDRINILIGPLSSANAAATKGFLVSSRMPTLVEATVDDVIDGKYLFRTSFSANADSFLQGYLAGKAGFKRAIAVAPNFNAGQVSVEYFSRGFAAAGGNVIQKLLPRLGTPDFGSTIGQFSDQADVGIIFMAGGDAVRFIKQYADYGKKLPLYGFTATVDETLLPAQGKAALGFVGASFYFSTLQTPENKQFVADYRAAYNQNPAWFAAGGYIAAQVLDQALQKISNLDDRDAVVAAIKAVKLTTPAGSFRFDENNNPIQPRYIMQIREVNGVVQPVILGTIAEFKPDPVPLALPPDLVLPK
jgi:branched-chain amino acid transport system substrate-binding protein